MTFDYRDLPIDPRVVRACGIEIHMGVVDPNDFATGMVSVDANGKRKSILRTTDAAGLPREDTLLVVGTVDNWFVKHTTNGSEIRISGRDVRGILLDAIVDSRVFNNLNLTKPIATSSNEDASGVVNQILSKHPMGSRIIVEINPDDWGGFEASTGLLPSPGVKGNLTRVNLGANGNGSPESKPAGTVDKVNFWDLITRYCFLVGAIPYFVGQKLRVRPSRSIFDQEKLFDPRVKSPFADGKPRRSPGDQPSQFNVRRLVYGRDIAEMTFERKYQGTKVPTVECVSIDTSSSGRGQSKLIRARSSDPPPQTTATGKPVKTRSVPNQGSSKATSVSPSGSATQEDVLKVPVPGISSQEQLRQIAVSIHEEIGRGEMGGSVSTKSLASFLVPSDPQDQLAGNKDPDLIKLRPGDAVELRVDSRPLSSTTPLVSSYTDSIRRSFDEEVADLKKRLGNGAKETVSGDLARVIVATARGGIVELSKAFRAENVKFSWAAANGIGVDFDYRNYVEVRYNTAQSDGANILPPVRNTAGK
jgi:hypothetical protein